MVHGNEVCVIADPLIKQRDGDANAVKDLPYQLHTNGVAARVGVCRVGVCRVGSGEVAGKGGTDL
jgi:hypothetical protein